MTDDLPQGWAWATLGELVSSKPNAMTDGPFGSKLKSEHYTSSGVRVIRLGNIGAGIFHNHDQAFIDHARYETLRKHEVRPGDLLIAALADPVGRCCRVPLEMQTAIVKADCIRFVPHEELEPVFLMDWLNSPAGLRQSEETAHGVGRLRMNMEEMRSLRVPMAPLAEQRRIVAKIKELTARSRAARTALAELPTLLEQFRQSVLASAFRGDLTADWRAKNPNTEPASVLLDRIRAERRRQWEQKYPKKKYTEPRPVDDSDLPELPEGWCWANWNELAEWITYGFTRPMPHVESGPRIVTAKNVQNGELAFEGSHRTTPEAYTALSDKDRPLPGDILITKDGTIGRAAIVPDTEPFCINQSVAVVWMRGCPADRNYLLRVIQSPLTQTRIAEAAQGMAIQHLSITDFGRFPLPLPPIAEQSLLVKRLDGKLSAVEIVLSVCKKAHAELDQLDQSILSKAFRGELVPQDPADEPAAVLLERLRAAQAESSTNGTSRRKARK